MDIRSKVPRVLHMIELNIIITIVVIVIINLEVFSC